jgi:hypothetical protein
MASLDRYSAVQYVGTTVAFTANDPTAPGGVRDVMGRVVAVWFDPKEGPILEIEGYGEIPLSNIHGVTIIV